MRINGCSLLFFLTLLIAFLFLHLSSVSPAEPTDEWVNIYNLTGIDEPSIVEISPNGSFGCIADSDGYQAELWDIENETQTAILDINGVPLDIEYSPDGLLIAVARGPGFEEVGLALYHSSNGSRYEDATLPTSNCPRAIEWGSEGERIFIGSDNGFLYVVNVSSWTLEEEVIFPNAGKINSLNLSPNGTLIGFLSSNGSCTIINASNFEVIAVLPGTASNFKCGLSWSFDGRYLGLPYGEGDTVIYSCPGFSIEKRYQVSQLQFSPTRSVLLLGYGTGSAQIINLDSWTERHRFGGIVGAIDLVSWARNGNVFSLGSSNDTTVRIYVDIESPQYDKPPSVSIIFPSENEVIDTLAEFHGRAQDDRGIEFVMARIDQHEWEMLDSTREWSWIPYYSKLENGTHILQVRAFDGFQFSLTRSVSFILNFTTDINTMPTIDILFPTDKSVFYRRFPILGTCDDDTEVIEVRLSIGNISRDVVPNENGIWEWEPPWDDLENGTYEISATAFDGELLSQYHNITVFIVKNDNVTSPPILSVLEPVNHSIVQGIVEFRGVVYPEEPDGIVILELGDTARYIANGYAKWNCSIDTRRIIPGEYLVKVWAFARGVPSPEVLLVMYIQEYEEVTVIVDWPKNSSIVKGDVNCTGRAIGSDTISDVHLMVDDSDTRHAHGTFNWYYILNTSTLSDGEHQLTFWATHLFGDSKRVQIDIFVNNTEIPADSLTRVFIDEPKNRTTLSNDIVVQGHASDDIGIQYIQLRIDNGEWMYASGKEEWFFYLRITDYADGWHNISARAFDGYGYSDIEILQVEIRNNVNEYHEGPPFILIPLLIIIVISFITILYIYRDRFSSIRSR